MPIYRKIYNTQLKEATKQAWRRITKEEYNSLEVETGHGDGTIMASEAFIYT